MKLIYTCCFLALVAGYAEMAPVNNFVFPDQRRYERKLEPITPPVLPILEHLERDPSTLLPGEGGRRGNVQVKPRFGFGGGGGFNVRPSGNGGLSASISSSASGAGLSQSASQSFSFGFNEGFSASQSASQASSFNGFGSLHQYFISNSSSFGGSQASSQAASFSGGGASLSGAASSASALGGFNSLSGSQSASSAFGFNSLNGFQPESSFGDGIYDVRHRGVPGFPFSNFSGRSKNLNAAAFKRPLARNDNFLALLVSN